MRILISAESFLPRSNGVTNSVVQASKHLVNFGHQVMIIAPGEGPTSLDGIEIVRVPALALQRFAQVDIPRVTKNTLVKSIYAFRPDVVYLASPFFLGDQVRKAAKICGIPTVANYQTDVSGFAAHYGIFGAKKLIEKRMYKIHSKSTVNLAPSTSAAKYLKNLGVENVRLWGRGVDHARFQPERRSLEFRKLIGADSNTLVIGFAGRLAPEKQVDKLNLLSDISHLLERPVQLLIVGDGPAKKNLQKSLPKAYFTGHLSGNDLSQAMASMDVMITTGENETFCQVIQEAMACGVPVVAPGIGGPIDLISDGVNGALYKAGPNTSLRKAVLRVAHNEITLHKMKQSAFDTVKHKSWENICSELEAILENAILDHKHRLRRVA